MHLLFLDYFNAGMEGALFKIFCCNCKLISMRNKPTCYKNPDAPCCIDLIWTNWPRSCTIETDLADFLKVVFTVMKTSYGKIKVINCLDFQDFSNKFRESLHKILSRTTLLCNCNEQFNNFLELATPF